MPLTVISENSERDIQRRRLHREFVRTLRVLTANLLRMTRGAGKPEQFIPQLAALTQAMARYTIALDEMPSLDGVLQIDPGPELELPPEEEAIKAARDQMIGGALQIVASRLMGQKVNEQAGMVEMFVKGNDALEAALQALHRRKKA